MTSLLILICYMMQTLLVYCKKSWEDSSQFQTEVDVVAYYFINMHAMIAWQRKEKEEHYTESNIYLLIAIENIIKGNGTQDLAHCLFYFRLPLGYSPCADKITVVIILKHLYTILVKYKLKITRLEWKYHVRMSNTILICFIILSLP